MSCVSIDLDLLTLGAGEPGNKNFDSKEIKTCLRAGSGVHGGQYCTDVPKFREKEHPCISKQDMCTSFVFDKQNMACDFVIVVQGICSLHPVTTRAWQRSLSSFLQTRFLAPGQAGVMDRSIELDLM